MSDLNNIPSGNNPDDGNDPKSNMNNLGHGYPLLSPVAAAFFGLIGCFFLYQFVGGLLTILIFGTDLERADITSLRLMTIAGQLLFILLPALVFGRVIFGNVSKVIYTKIPKWSEVALFTGGIIILTPLLQVYLYIQNYFIEQLAASYSFVNSIKSFLDSLNELMEKLLGNLIAADTLPDMLLVIFVVAVIPAIAEETMFRGYIQRSFGYKFKPATAALITAIFFGLYHMEPYSLIPLITLGFYFGYSSYKSKTLLIPIFLHFLNNFSAIVMYYIWGDDVLVNSGAANSSELNSSILMFVILSILFAIIIIVTNKFYSQERLNQ